MTRGIAECMPCWRWAWIPKAWNELKHNIRCPECGAAMHPIRNGTPDQVGWREDQRVEATLVNLAEKV